MIQNKIKYERLIDRLETFKTSFDALKTRIKTFPAGKDLVVERQSRHLTKELEETLGLVLSIAQDPESPNVVVSGRKIATPSLPQSSESQQQDELHWTSKKLAETQQELFKLKEELEKAQTSAQSLADLAKRSSQRMDSVRNTLLKEIVVLKEEARRLSMAPDTQPSFIVSFDYISALVVHLKAEEEEREIAAIIEGGGPTSQQDGTPEYLPSSTEESDVQRLRREGYGAEDARRELARIQELLDFEKETKERVIRNYNLQLKRVRSAAEDATSTAEFADAAAAAVAAESKEYEEKLKQSFMRAYKEKYKEVAENRVRFELATKDTQIQRLELDMQAVHRAHGREIKDLKETHARKLDELWALEAALRTEMKRLSNEAVQARKECDQEILELQSTYEGRMAATTSLLQQLKKETREKDVLIQQLEHKLSSHQSAYQPFLAPSPAPPRRYSNAFQPPAEAPVSTVNLSASPSLVPSRRTSISTAEPQPQPQQIDTKSFFNHHQKPVVERVKFFATETAEEQPKQQQTVDVYERHLEDGRDAMINALLAEMEAMLDGHSKEMAALRDTNRRTTQALAQAEVKRREVSEESEQLREKVQVLTRQIKRMLDICQQQTSPTGGHHETPYGVLSSDGVLSKDLKDIVLYVGDLSTNVDKISAAQNASILPPPPTDVAISSIVESGSGSGKSGLFGFVMSRPTTHREMSMSVEVGDHRGIASIQDPPRTLEEIVMRAKARSAANDPTTIDRSNNPLHLPLPTFASLNHHDQHNNNELPAHGASIGLTAPLHSVPVPAVAHTAAVVTSAMPSLTVSPPRSADRGANAHSNQLGGHSSQQMPPAVAIDPVPAIVHEPSSQIAKNAHVPHVPEILIESIPTPLPPNENAPPPQLTFAADFDSSREAESSEIESESTKPTRVLNFSGPLVAADIPPTVTAAARYTAQAEEESESSEREEREGHLLVEAPPPHIVIVEPATQKPKTKKAAQRVPRKREHNRRNRHHQEAQESEQVGGHVDHHIAEETEELDTVAESGEGAWPSDSDSGSNNNDEGDHDEVEGKKGDHHHVIVSPLRQSAMSTSMEDSLLHKQLQLQLVSPKAVVAIAPLPQRIDPHANHAPVHLSSFAAPLPSPKSDAESIVNPFPHARSTLPPTYHNHHNPKNHHAAAAMAAKHAYAPLLLGGGTKHAKDAECQTEDQTWGPPPPVLAPPPLSSPTDNNTLSAVQLQQNRRLSVFASTRSPSRVHSASPLNHIQPTSTQHHHPIQTRQVDADKLEELPPPITPPLLSLPLPLPSAHQNEAQEESVELSIASFLSHIAFPALVDQWAVNSPIGQSENGVLSELLSYLMTRYPSWAGLVPVGGENGNSALLGRWSIATIGMPISMSIPQQQDVLLLADSNSTQAQVQQAPLISPTKEGSHSFAPPLTRASAGPTTHPRFETTSQITVVAEEVEREDVGVDTGGGADIAPASPNSNNKPLLAAAVSQQQAASAKSDWLAVSRPIGKHNVTLGAPPPEEPEQATATAAAVEQQRGSIPLLGHSAAESGSGISTQQQQPPPIGLISTPPTSSMLSSAGKPGGGAPLSFISRPPPAGGPLPPPLSSVQLLQPHVPTQPPPLQQHQPQQQQSVSFEQSNEKISEPTLLMLSLGKERLKAKILQKFEQALSSSGKAMPTETSSSTNNSGGSGSGAFMKISGLGSSKKGGLLHRRSVLKPTIPAPPPGGGEISGIGGQKLATNARVKGPSAAVKPVGQFRKMIKAGGSTTCLDPSDLEIFGKTNSSKSLHSYAAANSAAAAALIYEEIINDQSDGSGEFEGDCAEFSSLPINRNYSPHALSQSPTFLPPISSPSSHAAAARYSPAHSSSPSSHKMPPLL